MPGDPNTEDVNTAPATSPGQTRLSGLLFNHKRYNILAYLLTYADEQLTIGEIIDDVDVSRPHVTNFVNDLRDLGLVEKQKKGNLYLITVNEDSPYIGPLRTLLAIDAEPLRLAAIDFTDKMLQTYGDSIKAVYLFGSVARGTPRIDSDIDILLIHDKLPERTTSQIEGMANQYGDKHGVTFSLTWYRLDEWRRDQDHGIAFVERIKQDAEQLAGEDLT